MAHVQVHIRYNSYIKPPTLHEHLWILRKLLAKKYTPVDEENNNGLAKCLMRYIIATCYPKMYHRLTQEHLSAPYLDSLKSVKMEEIEFHESEPRITKSDMKFFLHFLPLFLDANHAIQSKIPNIRKQTDLMIASDSEAGPAPHLNKQHKPIHFYTKDTYQEFHTLLLVFLDIFQQSLKYLNDSASAAATGGAAPSKFSKNVSLFMVAGSGLQLLTRGAVLGRHLKTIEASLKEHRRVNTVSVSTDDSESMEEQDEDLKAVQPHAKIVAPPSQTVILPLHVSYNEWLKLMLIYFDAVDKLSQFGSQFQFDEIRIDILVSPPVSNTLLPWRDLFSYPGIFPAKNVPANEQISVIFDYLKTSIAQSFDRSTESAKIVLAALKHPKKNSVSLVKYNLKRLENSALPGWAEIAKDLHSKIENMEKIEGDVKEMLMKDIAFLFESTNYLFLKFLRTADLKGLFFSGTQHCEISILSFLKHSKCGTIDDICKAIRAQLEVFPTLLHDSINS